MVLNEAVWLRACRTEAAYKIKAFKTLSESGEKALGSAPCLWHYTVPVSCIPACSQGLNLNRKSPETSPLCFW